MLGVSQGYIGDIEAGRSEPSRNFLTTLQEKFGVPTDYILYGTRAHKPAPDRLRLMLCGAMVREEHARADRTLSDEALFAQAIDLYELIPTLIDDPEDGDALEAITPQLRDVIRKKIEEDQ